MIYDLSGNICYWDDRPDAELEYKQCDHCHSEVDAHLLSKNLFCPTCQAEADQEEWEYTMDVIIKSI
jgi:RNA polymerase subunit RPABC4/transcription elongation factor Spt4